MPGFRSVLPAVLIGLASLPALAQQTPGSGEPTYRYSPMWHDGWGWHHGMIFGPVVMVLMVVVAVMLALMVFRGAVRSQSHPWDAHGQRRMGDALDILEQRFARGEIDQAEFEMKRTLLGR